MKINLENDYANRIIYQFAKSPEGTKLRSKDLAEELHIPTRFTYRILRKLMTAGILESVRGSKGGYKLAKDPSQIDLLDVYNAISEKLEITCCDHGCECIGTDNELCPLHKELCRINKLIKTEFDKVDFKQLIEKE